MRQPCFRAIVLAVVAACAAPAIAVPRLPATAPAAPSTALAAPATAPAAPSTAPATAPSAKPRAAAVPDRPLLTDELRALYDDGRYQDLLKALGRVLQLKGKAAEAYDRYELLTLKAETHLRLKAPAAAQAAFAQAAEATDHPKNAAVARATVLLLKRSKNLTYAPSARKAEKSPPIDVVDAESRTKALRALLADEMAVAGPKVEAALDGRSLAPIADALRAIQGLDVLEAAVDEEGEARQLVQDLRERGQALMAKSLERLGKRVEDVEKSANATVEYKVFVPVIGGGAREETRTRKRGLLKQDRDDLKQVIETCAQIAPNAVGLAQATGGKKKDVEDLVDFAEDLSHKADRVLKADYGQ